MKILVADDERDIADAIGIILKYSGYDSDIVYDGVKAYEMASNHVYDGIVLDIMMPGMDGIEVLEKLREDGDVTPILLLTAKAQVEDRILGLNRGADDYLAKPFDKGELIARIQVMVRRQNSYAPEIRRLGNTELHMGALEIENAGRSLRLSGREIEILEFFMKHANKWIAKDLIIEKLWKEEPYEEGTIKLYIGYLKNKLQAIGSDLMIEKVEEEYRITTGA